MTHNASFTFGNGAQVKFSSVCELLLFVLGGYIFGNYILYFNPYILVEKHVTGFFNKTTADNLKVLRHYSDIVSVLYEIVFFSLNEKAEDP